MRLVAAASATARHSTCVITSGCSELPKVLKPAFTSKPIGCLVKHEGRTAAISNRCLHKPCYLFRCHQLGRRRLLLQLNGNRTPPLQTTVRHHDHAAAIVGSLSQRSHAAFNYVSSAFAFRIRLLKLAPQPSAADFLPVGSNLGVKFPLNFPTIDFAYALVLHDATTCLGYAKSIVGKFK